VEAFDEEPLLVVVGPVEDRHVGEPPSGQRRPDRLGEDLAVDDAGDPDEGGVDEVHDRQVAQAAHAAGKPRPEVKLPVGFTTFPGEIFRAPRSWAEKAYPNLTYFNQVDKGGHFAAWEEPELFATEIRAAFKSMR
jgi:hypothetical protein